MYSQQEKYFDYRNDLHKVKAKTLIIVGDQDWICPPSKYLATNPKEMEVLIQNTIGQSRIIAEKIQDSRLLIVPGANHSVQVEKNAEFLQAVRELLKQ